MKRSWIKPLDLLLIGAILLSGCLLVLLMHRRPAGDTVRIYVENTLYDELSLSDALPVDYCVFTERGSLYLAFSEDGVSVTASDCPDDVCVRTGKIARTGESIVCAPLGVCITVGDGGLDGVTG